jgi:hypothetical protein
MRDKEVLSDFFLRWDILGSFPDTDREDKYRDNNHRTHRAEWTKYRDNIFLVDHIRVKHHPTKSEACEYFGWEHRFRKPTPKSDKKKDRIYDSSYHREGHLKISDRENNSSYILKDSTAGKFFRNITGHHLECSTISPIPKFIRRDWEINSIEDADGRENSDDEIFFHNKKGEEIGQIFVLKNSRILQECIYQKITTTRWSREGEMCSYQVMRPYLVG